MKCSDFVSSVDLNLISSVEEEVLDLEPRSVTVLVLAYAKLLDAAVMMLDSEGKALAEFKAEFDKHLEILRSRKP